MDNNRDGEDDTANTGPDVLHLYAVLDIGKPSDLGRKQIHNQCTLDTLRQIEEANSIAESVNNWLPSLKRTAQIKKILQFVFLFFGGALVIWGVLSGSYDNGKITLDTDQIGIILAGIGIIASSIVALISWNDDIMRLLTISQSDGNQLFSELSIVKSQLSFIINEIIDIKDN